MTASASDAAQQTRELARSVLDQARLTQADVLNKSSEFQKNVEGAADKIVLLNNAQEKAMAVTATLSDIPLAASEAKHVHLRHSHVKPQIRDEVFAPLSGTRARQSVTT